MVRSRTCNVFSKAAIRFQRACFSSLESGKTHSRLQSTGKCPYHVLYYSQRAAFSIAGRLENRHPSPLSRFRTHFSMSQVNTRISCKILAFFFPACTGVSIGFDEILPHMAHIKHAKQNKHCTIDRAIEWPLRLLLIAVLSAFVIVCIISSKCDEARESILLQMVDTVNASDGAKSVCSARTSM